MSTLGKIGAVLLISGLSVGASATTLQITISGGVYCPLQSPCATSSDAFFDVTQFTFTATIATDGTLTIESPIVLAFDSGSQSITLTGASTFAPDQFNPPVVAGEVPNGNWTGMFNYASSDGGAGTLDLAPNSGQTFFIDNEDGSFNLSLNGGDGATQIEFFATGFVEVAPIPLPAAAWFFISALGSLALSQRRSV
ncbi:MAG: VPLPA-CTERM sorting domain-containing protein [Pseudomonadota bacterium]